MNNKPGFDVRLFLGLFAISVLVNYYLPSFLRYFWFFGLLAAFLFTKNQNNYFWIVLFWLLFSSPGYLFYKTGLNHLPVISIAGLGRNVYYDELFGILVVIKAFWRPVKQTVFYRNQLILIILYSVFLLFLGLLSGNGILTILKSVRYFIPLLMLIVIPRLIPYYSIQSLIKLMFISSFILVGSQLFDIVFGYPIAAFFGETQLMVSGKEVGSDFSAFDVTNGAIRTIYGPFLLLFSLVMSLVLLKEGGKTFKPWYLYMISLLTTLSIFMSATRGWIIASVLILAGIALAQNKKFSAYIFSGIIIILLAFSVPRLNTQIVQSFKRVLTLEALAKGDLTADGSLTRITERSPRVMNKFWEQPIWGFGFTDEYYEYADGHVGNQTLLLNGGIVGYMIFLYFILYLLYKYYRAYSARKNKLMIFFILGLLALITIHSTSSMVFGYSLNVNGAISLSLFFFFSDYYLKQRNVENHIPSPD